MSGIKHTHRYERVILGKDNKVYFRCNLPDCTHYIQKKLVAGKRSICNRCGDEFLLDTRALKFEKPYCVNCVKIRKKPMHDKLLEFVMETETSASKT